jgi:antirestriction protein ArdC
VQGFLEAIPIRVVHGGDSAHYSPGTDTVTLPNPSAFHSIEAYFSTRCHELGHNAATRIMPHGVVGS